MSYFEKLFNFTYLGNLEEKDNIAITILEIMTGSFKQKKNNEPDGSEFLYFSNCLLDDKKDTKKIRKEKENTYSSQVIIR